MIFVGIDWAERHHDVCVLDEAGTVLAKGRVPDGLDGVARLHAMVATDAEEPGEVVVGIETDRGLLVGALAATGYRVYAVNPFSVSRYRERHTSSGTKSDPGDAKVLADLVRTDRHNHRQVAGDSELAEAVKVLARAHQGLIWSRQRQVNALRNTLREFHPGALDAFGDLGSPDALAVLAIAPTPSGGRALSFAKIRRALQAGGRTRNLDRRATEVFEALRRPQLEAPPMVAVAYGESVRSMVGVIRELVTQTERLEKELAERFEGHPDAEILRSLPGLGLILGARVLAEFGDDRPATAMLRRDGATRGQPPAPEHRGPASSCWPGWPETAASPTPATTGPSRRSTPHRERVVTTIFEGPVATPTTRRCVPSPTGSWASFMVVCSTGRRTGRTSHGRALLMWPLDGLRPWDV